MRRNLATVALALAMTMTVNVQAQDAAPAADEASLAELPYWPIGRMLPEKLGDGKPRNPKDTSADLLVWVPDGAKQIRALLIIVNNSDSKHFGEHDALRAVARKHDMGVLYLRRMGLESRMDDTQALMDFLAKETGIQEFRHVPWITFGKSSRGRFPFYMAWKFPKRTVATISYHAETPTWPMAEWARTDDETILHCSANGETEWGGTFAKHVRPSLLNYRANTSWLPHQVVSEGVDHGNYVDSNGSAGWGKEFPDKVTVIDVWNYLSLYVDKALTLRLPEGYPTDKPLPLKKVDPSKGLLIEPFAIEDIFRKPRMPLIEKDGTFIPNAEPEATTNGYTKIAPAANYTPAEGVPVVDFAAGDSPTQWLLAKGLSFAMKADPMLDVKAFAALRPAPGDSVDVDGKQATFTTIADREVGNRGGQKRGVSIKNLGFRGRNISLLGYTVLKVDKPTTVKVVGYHSLAVRMQIVLNGEPVAHNEVVELQKGLYPMLFVVRMTGVTWGEVEPGFVSATEEEIAEAKKTQVEKSRREAELAARLAENRKPSSYIHKYADVPADQRDRMMWIADQEQADAWIKLHDPATRQGK